MKKKKVVTGMLSLAMALSLLAGCGSDTNNADSGEPAGGTSKEESSTEVQGENGAADDSQGAAGSDIDLSETVNLVMYLYGSEGVANQDILEELNKKLLADINTTLEIKYIDWGDVSTKYPLLWAAGEKFDMAYSSTGAPVPYVTLAKQDALVDITDMLDTYSPVLKESLDQVAWESMKVDGRIYGIPSTYSEFTAQGFITRTDLMEKYEISAINSVEDMEAYMDAAVEDGWIPLNGSSNLAYDMYRMFLALTDDWIDAPGLPTTNLYLAGGANNPKEIFHPAFSDEFEEFAVKMSEWSDKGYWSKDVLSAAQDDKDNFHNGVSASYITHQPDWTGSHGAMMEKLPGVGTEFYCFPEANGKIIRKMGCENATAISANSKYPERCLVLIEKLMTDEECYRLFQYGIEGRQFEVVDGMSVKPEGFNEEVDGGGFAGWALRTDALNIPYATEDPRRYTLNEEWKSVAIDNPYVGFSFDSSNVTTELSALANVDSQLGMQILLGKTSKDPKDAVAEYRNQLEMAGIEAVLNEVNAQYEAFLNQ